MLDSKRKGRVAIGAVGLILGFGYILEALKLPLGQTSSPGPGVYPVVVGIAAVVISIIVIVQAWFTDDVSGEVGFPSGRQLLKSIRFFAATVGLVVLLPFLGQYIVASVYFVLMIRWLGDTSWRKSVVYGVFAGVCFSWVFIEVFNVPMPLGILQDIL